MKPEESAALVLILVFFSLGYLRIVNMSAIPVLGSLFPKPVIRIAVYGENSSASVQSIVNLLQSPEAKQKNLFLSWGPRTYSVAWKGAFEGFDVLVVPDSENTSQVVREAVKDYLAKGGKLVLVGNSLSKVAEDPYVVGWSDLDQVPVRCEKSLDEEGFERCHTVFNTDWGFEVKDNNHVVTASLPQAKQVLCSLDSWQYCSIYLSLFNASQQTPSAVGQGYATPAVSDSDFQVDIYEVDPQGYFNPETRTVEIFFSGDLPYTNFLSFYNVSVQVNNTNTTTSASHTFVLCANRQNKLSPGCNALLDCTPGMGQLACEYTFRSDKWPQLALEDDSVNVSVTMINTTEYRTNWTTDARLDPEYVSLDDHDALTANTPSSWDSLSQNKWYAYNRAAESSDKLSLTFKPSGDSEALASSYKWWDIFDMNVSVYYGDTPTTTLAPTPVHTILSPSQCTSNRCEYTIPDYGSGYYRLNITLLPKADKAQELGVNTSGYFVSYYYNTSMSKSTLLTRSVEKPGSRVLAFVVSPEGARYSGIVESGKVMYFAFNPVLLKTRFLTALEYLGKK